MTQASIERRLRTALAAAILVALPVVTAPGAFAADREGFWEITPFVGYQFGGQIQTSQGDLQLNDGMNFGGTLARELGHGRWVEFTYNHHATSVQLDNPGSAAEDVFDVTAHYIHIGGRYETAHEGAKVVPFGAGGLGITVFDPKPDDLSSATRFSIDLAGGVIAPVNERVGIRAQFRGWFNVMDSGSTIFCSGGCYGTISGWVVAQGELSGGLVFRF